MRTVARRWLTLSICVGAMVLCIPSAHAGATYYVDSLTGDDANNGRDPTKAWQSLAKVNSIEFHPGDRILFKSGTQYSGQLSPRGSGKLVDGKPNPIVIDRFGQGRRPRLDGDGVVQSTLYLFNVEYWEVSGLEITNQGPQRESGRRGVHVHIKDFGTAHHIQLKDLYIHDVNGSIYKKKGGGSAILWQNEGRRKRSRFDGLLIENCHLKRCTRNGINARGYSNRRQWYPSLNVVVRHCLLEEIPGDGIVPIACDGALIEHNVMRNCPRLLEPGDAAAGIWPWSCDNTVIQFNEVSDHKAPWDAQGFDSDWNCRNTLIQYNYSHDNEGGFLLVCNNGGATPPSNIGNRGTVIRYNISINDGLRATPTHQGVFSPVFHITGPCKNTKIYNNVIYINRKPDDKIDRTIVKMDNWGGTWPEDTLFANNIFYVEDEASFQFGEDQKTMFKNNVFYGKIRHEPGGTQAKNQDPMFQRLPSGTGGSFPALKAFMLQKGSPCVAAAHPIHDNGGRDFFGNPVPQDGPKCIGIHEANAERRP
ncbi:hypothetical protein CA13_38220 [Planctomycetes bacterium CA13]|uniref:Right handed beta helix domain-containing protein n=1 Tax=Novipirellula herctigrandis TaxID=2527986 RepID=A0A5C5Z586_9BACT|nr:hypothetical protein CA13_38220 [Planctomycetes bacterium CA13]